MSQQDKKQGNEISSGSEPEHHGPFWTHPYVLYIGLTAVLFGLLLFAGWLGLKSGWIASSGG